MSTRPNVLVVCGRNKKRSRTAEHFFKNDDYKFMNKELVQMLTDRINDTLKDVYNI